MSLSTKPIRWDWILIALALTFPVSTSAQELEREQLKQDLNFLKQALIRDHAGLYRYKSKSTIENIFDSCSVALTSSQSVLEFGKTVMFLISAIEDGHTGTSVPRLLMDHYTGNKKLFPINLHFVNNKAYVQCSGNKLFPNGTEVLAIDNIRVANIREILFQYLPSDGKIQTKKQHVLNNGAFPIIYTWIFGVKDSFKVKYRLQNKKIETAFVTAAEAKDADCNPGQDNKEKKALQLDSLTNKVALLTVKTFDHNRFSELIEEYFQGIDSKKIEKLIIDLRGNAGGADANGAKLYSYIAKEPFKYFASINSTTSIVSSNENPLLSIQQPQKFAFHGEVVFLINGLSFSTTADFCSIARSNNRGLFVGEETGGGYYGNTSGEIKKIELLNSKIEIKIPLWKYVNDVKTTVYKNRGVLPDYTIIPSVNDIITGNDVQLDFAIKLVSARQK